MRLRVLSDLHLEHFYGQTLRDAYLHKLDLSDVDVLILAGDIGSYYDDTLKLGLELLAKKGKPIIFVPGNHEPYLPYRGVKPVDEQPLRSALHRKYPNLHWMDNSVVEIDGVRFLGTTLWYPDDITKTLPYKRGWSDFIYIPGFESWVYRENAKAVTFLKRTLRPGDVVVTHFLPTYASVAREYKGHKDNSFFVSDLSNLILDGAPALWAHGHTHESMDYMLGQTHIVCNPFGYWDGVTNPNFELNLSVEVRHEDCSVDPQGVPR